MKQIATTMEARGLSRFSSAIQYHTVSSNIKQYVYIIDKHGNVPFYYQIVL